MAVLRAHLSPASETFQANQAAHLSSLAEILGPLEINALRYPLTAAQLCNAALTA